LRNTPQTFARLLDGGDVIASYRAQWQYFVHCIHSGAAVKPGFADGRSALQIALTAVQSAHTGRPIRVVQAADAIAPLATPMPDTRIVG
jgi:predicted dehydrogenase